MLARQLARPVGPAPIGYRPESCRRALLDPHGIRSEDFAGREVDELTHLVGDGGLQRIDRTEDVHAQCQERFVIIGADAGDSREMDDQFGALHRRGQSRGIHHIAFHQTDVRILVQ